MKEKVLSNRKVQVGFGSAILTLLIVGGLSYRGMDVSAESDRWLRHTHMVLENIRDMLSAMRGVDSGDGGFAVTGNESYVKSYRADLKLAEGYLRDELIGRREKNIILEGSAERLVADGTLSAAEALAQQIGTGIERIGRRKKGSEFPIEMMLSPVKRAEGILVTAAICDITAPPKSEAHRLQNVKELNRSNEELGQFGYIASHDLQEPLRTVAMSFWCCVQK